MSKRCCNNLVYCFYFAIVFNAASGIDFTQQTGYIKGDRFLQRIYDGFEPGKQIKITGVVRNSRFDINLQRDNHFDDSDIALHFSSRTTADYITLTSRINGHWGKDENYVGLPFDTEGEIELAIISLSSSYKIEINGKFVYEFNYRVDPASVIYLAIEGNFEVKDVIVANAANGFKQQPQFIEIVNFLGPFVEGFNVGNTVTVEGIISQDAKKIDINLQEGIPFEYDNDIPLQIIIDFNNDEIRLRSFIDKVWTTVLTQKCADWLQPGQSFAISFTRQSTYCMVEINEKFFGELEASNMQNVHKLVIEGDMYLLSNIDLQ